MIRGRTLEDDSTTGKSGRTRDYPNDRSYGSAYDGITKLTNLGAEEASQYRVLLPTMNFNAYLPFQISSVGSRKERSANEVDKLETRLVNIERLLLSLCNQRPEGQFFFFFLIVVLSHCFFCLQGR